MSQVITSGEMRISDLIAILTTIKEQNGDLKLKMDIDSDLNSIDRIDVTRARKYRGRPGIPAVYERADSPTDASNSCKYTDEIVVVIS